MSDQSGSVSSKFRSHFFIEIALIAALAFYLVLAEEQVVGDDLAFTVIGAGLMALVTYWTLNTLRDALEVVVAWTGRLRH